MQDDGTSHEIRVENVLAVGQEYHFSLTFGSDGMNAYLDGVLVGSNSYTGGLSGNTEPIVIGANQWASSNNTADNIQGALKGEISEVRLYNQAFDEAEISELALGKTLYGTDGIDVFNFDTLDHQTFMIEAFDVSQGDAIDISDILTSYDVQDQALSDFIQISESNGNTVISVSITGEEGGFQAALEIIGLVGLPDAEQLVSDGVLII